MDTLSELLIKSERKITFGVEQDNEFSPVFVASFFMFDDRHEYTAETLEELIEILEKVLQQ